ncbi:MAG: hypothetical protein CV088_17570 [Nitrospira sp. LK70]|nr:hypothetical protein [Nitrospira sp. LK70]
MKTEEILQRLEGVRSRGPGRWSSICPSHDDRSPSLSVRDGERGVLVRCWAGCTVQDICAALNLRLSDLFHNAPFPRGFRPIPKTPRVDRRLIALRLELHGVLLQDRANAVLQAAGGLDTSQWSNSDLEKAMDVVGRAFDELSHAETLFAVADSQRERAYEEGRSMVKHR